MQLFSRIDTNRVFLLDSEEARFRLAYEEATKEAKDSDGQVQIVAASSKDPETVGRILGLLESEVPFLLSSDEWSDATRNEVTRLRGVNPGKGTIIFKTGGSSGIPRFAVHDQRSLGAAAVSVWNYLENRPLCSRLDLPLYHVSGMMPVFRALVSDGVLISDGSQEASCEIPGLFLQSVVPTTLERTLRTAPSGSNPFPADIVFGGGASFDHQLLREAKRRGIPLRLVYGMTETGGMVGIQTKDAWESERFGELSMLPGNKVDVTAGKEITIQSPQLFRGYWGEEEHQGLFRTGDAGELIDGRSFTVHGRIGRFVSSGGETISLAKVEDAARKLQGVRDAVAIGMPDEEWGTRITLLVELEVLQNREIRNELRASLDSFELPQEVRAVKVIPRNAVGKVDLDQIFG
ncbi:MAG: AMP-binding protein [Verrucomicrobiota bacterium]